MSTLKEISNQFFEKTARVDEIILLATALGEMTSFSDRLKEMLEDTSIEDLEQMLGPIPKRVLDSLSTRDMAEVFGEWAELNGKLGYCVLFSTPVFKPLSNGGSSYSWGYFQSKWIYADDIESALNLGLQWVDSCREYEKDKLSQSQQA